MAGGKRKGIRALLPSGRLETALFALSLALSLTLAIAAVWYIISCVSIYSGGGATPFTRETVAAELKRLLPISIIAAVLMIAAGTLSLFTGKPKPTVIRIKSRTLVKITEKKLSAEHLSADYRDLCLREAAFRATTMTAIAAVSTVIAAVALIIIIDPSRYTVADVNTDIAYSTVYAGAATLLILAGVYTSSIVNELSYRRVLEPSREELSRQRAEGITPPPCDEAPLGEGHTVMLARLIIIAVAIAFIIIGIFNGGMADVLGKAVRICTECIGLG